MLNVAYTSTPNRIINQNATSKKAEQLSFFNK